MEKLNDIKIVFIDIDGTLVNDKKQITNVTKKSIKRITDKGILVVLVSGRDVFHTCLRSKNANASSIVISTNGAEIYDYEKGKHIFLDVIDREKVKKIFLLCEENEVGLILKSDMNRYHNKFVKSKEEEKKHGIYIEKIIDRIDEINFSQLLLVSKDSKKIEDISNYAVNLGLAVTNFSESFLEKTENDIYRLDINNPNINKGNAITYLLNYLNIEKESSICFGDFVNDIDMFNACGFKIAMGNAYKELKDKSDFITTSNNENGVAYFLDTYL